MLQWWRDPFPRLGSIKRLTFCFGTPITCMGCSMNLRKTYPVSFGILKPAIFYWMDGNGDAPMFHSSWFSPRPAPPTKKVLWSCLGWCFLSAMTPVVSLFCSFPVLENFQVPEFNAWWLSSRWPQRFHVWKDVLSGLIEIQFLERANKKLSKLKPKWVEVGLLICRCVDQSSLETDEVLALGLRTQWEFFFKKQCLDCNGCGLEMTGLAKGLKKLRW